METCVQISSQGAVGDANHGTKDSEINTEKVQVNVGNP